MSQPDSIRAARAFAKAGTYRQQTERADSAREEWRAGRAKQLEAERERLRRDWWR